MPENHEQSCPIERRHGDPCHRPINTDMPVPVCTEHALEVYRWVSKELARAVEIDDSAHHVRLDAAAMRRASGDADLVYYVQLPGNLIKIGYTSNIVIRLRDLAATRDDVLALEPGGFDVEQERHRQFTHLRWRRTERFHDAPELRAHIAAVLAEHGRPLIQGCGSEPKFVA